LAKGDIALLLLYSSGGIASPTQLFSGLNFMNEALFHQ